MVLLSGIAKRKDIAAIINQAIVSATNFFTGAIVARACAKETFGVYMLGFSIVLFLIGTQDSLILSPYTVYNPTLKGNDGARYAGSTLIHHFTFSAIVTLVLGVASALLSLGIGPQNLPPVLASLAVVITFILLRDYARRFCFANLRMNVAIVIDSSVGVAQIAGLLLLFHLGMLSASNAYLVIGFVCCLISLGWLAWTRKRFILIFSSSISDFAKNWSYGKWLFAGSIVYMVSVQLYPWILVSFYGPAAVATLAACLGLVTLVNPLTLGISNFIGPKMAHAYIQGIEELGQVVIKTTIFIVAVFGIVSMVIIFYGDQFIVLIYSPKYAGNGLIVLLLAISKFIIAAATPFGYALRTMERTDVTFKCGLIQLVITVSLGLGLVKMYGPLGVAYSYLLNSLTTCLVTYGYYLSKTRNILLEIQTIGSLK